MEKFKMDKKFTLSGTYDELNCILQEEFGLSENASKVATDLFVFEQNKELDLSESELDELWSFNGTGATYETRIFNTRFTINLTQSMLNAFDDLFIPVATSMVGLPSFSALEALFIGVKALAKNTYKIQNMEYCVYCQMLNYIEAHNTKWISPANAMPDCTHENICLYLDNDWGCPFRCGCAHENCKIKLADVETIMRTLCDNNVIRPSCDYTMFSFNI